MADIIDQAASMINQNQTQNKAAVTDDVAAALFGMSDIVCYCLGISMRFRVMILSPATLARVMVSSESR